MEITTHCQSLLKGIHCVVLIKSETSCSDKLERGGDSLSALMHGQVAPNVGLSVSEGLGRVQTTGFPPEKLFGVVASNF